MIKSAFRFLCGLNLLLTATTFSLTASAQVTYKSLVIGTSQEFDTLNQLTSTAAASLYITAMSNRTLVTVDADWHWQSLLCTEIPTLENGKAKIIDEGGKKKLVVTWTIKANASWGDGTPVTGKDIKISWDIGRSPTVSVGEKDLYDRIESIDIDPKDQKTFTMKFREPRYDYFQMASFYIVPAHLEGPIFERTKSQTGSYEKQSKYVTDPTNAGLYNGPYLINEVKLGSHVQLRRNPKFYGPKPKFENVTVKLIPNTQTLEANLVSGTIDMISEMGMTFDQAIAFDKRLNAQADLSKRFKLLFEDSLTYEHIEFNLDSLILRDVRVRKALTYAVDRQKLVSALFDNKQKVAHSHSHFKDVYYTNDVTKYEFSPEKAGKLLDEAGWKLTTGGYREKDGKRLTLTIMSTAQNKTRELVEVFIQEQFKKVGVELSINNVPARVLFGETTPKRLFSGLAMFAQTSSPDSPPRSSLHSKEIPTKQNGWGGQNYVGWKNQRNDEILDLVFQEFDLTKRKALMVEQQKIYTDELPHMPLYMRADVAVIPTNLRGFRLTGNQFMSTYNIENWSLAQ